MEMKDCPTDGCEVQVSSIVAHTRILGFYLAQEDLLFFWLLIAAHSTSNVSLCVKVCGLFSPLSVRFLRTEIVAFCPFPSAVHCASFDFADSMPLCETGSHLVARATL